MGDSGRRAHLEDYRQFHQGLASLPTSIAHRFNIYTRSRGNGVHLFVEGLDDEAFYPKFARRLSNGRPVICYRCNRKTAVLMWKYFLAKNPPPPNHILAFFVDRDLDDYLAPGNPSHGDLFVTAPYSVEGYIVSVEMLHRVWDGVFHFSELESHREFVTRAFERALDRFAQVMTPVMAWLLWHRLQGSRLIADNLSLEELFRIDTSTLEGQAVTDWVGVVSSADASCSVVTPPSAYSLLMYLETRITAHASGNWIRGKYLIWFFLDFLRKAREFVIAHAPPGYKPSTQRVTLGRSNAVDVLASHLDCPDDLQSFLQRVL